MFNTTSVTSVHFPSCHFRGQLKAVHPLNLNEDDPTVTLTAASPTSLDQLLGQREVKAGVGDRVQSPTTRRLYTHEYNVAAKLRLADLERVAVIGQGGFGRVELVCYPHCTC